MTLLMWEEEGGELLPERVWPGPEHHGTKNFLVLRLLLTPLEARVFFAAVNNPLPMLFT